MSGSVEERLRRALAQQAETTRTSPEGWQRIRAAIDGSRPVRRRTLLPWTVLVPVAAAVVLVVAVATLAARDGDRALHVTGDSGRLYLAPTGVEPRFHLDRASDGALVDPEPPWTFRAFVRRAPDGVAAEASVVITMPSDPAVNGTTPEAAPLRVLGRDVEVAGDPFGQRNVSWTQADGRSVGVMTFGLSQAELTAVAESVLAADAATAVPRLPAGFTPAGSGSKAGIPPMTLQNWQAADGDRFSVAVAEDPDATVDHVAWWLPGSRALKVRDTTGFHLHREESYLVWIERPGTVVTLQGRGLSEQELVAIANGLRPISDAMWRELTSRTPPATSEVVAVPDIGPPPGVEPDPNAYFVIVPVRARLASPCPAMTPGVFLTERTPDGREVACYQVSRPFVFADDVETAVVREDRVPGRWAVEYTLTQRGVARMEALFREVGAGGQVAVVVDGRVVFALRLEVATLIRGVVTALDEATARSLAERLGR